MYYAKKKKLLDNDYFDNLIESTKVGIQKAREKEAEKEKKEYGELEQDPYREITDSEIRDGINKSVAVDGLIYLTLNFRNNLAHGSSSLYPGSMSMLDKTASIINYIYRNY